MNDQDLTPEQASAKIDELFEQLNLGAGTIKSPTLRQTTDGWEHWAFVVPVFYKCNGPSDVHLFRYKRGIALPEPPKPSHVLASYCRDWLEARAPFEEWADTFGYDSDSRKAEKIYHQCRNCLPDGFLSRETIETFARLSSLL